MDISAILIFSIKYFRKLGQDLSSIPFFDEFNELTKKGFFAELLQKIHNQNYEEERTGGLKDHETDLRSKGQDRVHYT